MQITRYEPRKLFKNMSDEFNHLLAGRSGWPWMLRDMDFSSTAWTPSVDIKEEADHFMVRADVPGVEPKDVEVTLESNILNISGKRESEVKDEQDGYRRVEREYGEFHRQFMLPDSADPENVTAKCDKGVLEITIGKTEARKPKRITVES